MLSWAAITFFRPQTANLRRKLTPAAIVLGVGVLAVLTWRAAFHAPDGQMHVTLLEAGVGEAILDARRRQGERCW